MSDISILREPWPNVPRQREGAAFGMWVFIATELLFFGGLFLAYAVYRIHYGEAFRIAARETEIFYGGTNTVILLTSSLTMAVAVQASERGWRRMTAFCLTATLLLGIGFLIVKGFEYSSDLEKGLWPGPNFPLHPAATRLFWAFYWIATGVHAIHLTVGIGIVAVVMLLLVRRSVPITSPLFEGVALYWHLVDTIWVILLPLIYLVGRT
jgi:heme/copper-type cytochrome/quinol oxidase subunit 3